MAYAKKVTRGRYRSSRYRRRAWRRRYRRKYYRRRYRRARRSKVEYKRLEFKQDLSFKGNISNWSTTVGPQNVFYVAPDYYSMFVLGSYNVRFGEEIAQGTGINKRIGAKITPVSLRLYGTMSIIAKNQNFQGSQNEIGLTNVVPINQCMVRMIVFQVRNGNTGAYYADKKEFSVCNPYVTEKLYTGEQPQMQSYNNQQKFFYNDPGWFWRMFAIEKYITLYEVANGGAVFQVVSTEDRHKQGLLAKAPYRNGIGSAVKILKNKLYYLRPTTNGGFAFRTKIKRMHRMVWPEAPDGLEEDSITRDPRNPIYITFIPIFPDSLNQAQINITYYGQLYYTDK